MGINIPEEPSVYYISDIQLDVAPIVFFEWAYTTPAGLGPILYYCLNLSMEYLLEPAIWMIDVVNRVKYAPRLLSDGRKIL